MIVRETPCRRRIAASGMCKTTRVRAYVMRPPVRDTVTECVWVHAARGSRRVDRVPVIGAATAHVPTRAVIGVGPEITCNLASQGIA